MIHKRITALERKRLYNRDYMDYTVLLIITFKINRPTEQSMYHAKLSSQLKFDCERLPGMLIV